MASSFRKLLALISAKADASHTHTVSQVTDITTGLTGYYSTTAHNHNTAYLGITAKSSDSDLLDGNDSAYFSATPHNHTEANLVLADNTTANTSTSAHGFCPKLDNVVTNFLNGQGAFSAPAGGWVEVGDTTLTEAAASISFASITSGYHTFMVVLKVLKDANAGWILMRFNNDSGGNYDEYNYNYNGAGSNPGDTCFQFLNLAANSTGHGVAFVDNQATRYKGAQGYGGDVVGFRSFTGEYQSNTEISRIDIIASGNNLATGTRVIIYGRSD